jgi:hypothetical protein
VDEDGDPLVGEDGKPTAAAIDGAGWLAQYLLTQRAHLAALPPDDDLKGRLSWATAPDAAP